jgi:hypothetical protein
MDYKNFPNTTRLRHKSVSVKNKNKKKIIKKKRNKKKEKGNFNSMVLVLLVPKYEISLPLVKQILPIGLSQLRILIKLGRNPFKTNT